MELTNNKQFINADSPTNLYVSDEMIANSFKDTYLWMCDTDI